jgi:hypothetical protein
LQQPPDHHLAQLNIGRIRYEIDDPGMADLTNNLALVNGLAERSAGFIWRYADERAATPPTRGHMQTRVSSSIFRFGRASRHLNAGSSDECLVLREERTCRARGKADVAPTPHFGSD